MDLTDKEKKLVERGKLKVVELTVCKFCRSQNIEDLVEPYVVCLDCGKVGESITVEDFE